jgi:hypothetical protein
MKLADTGGAQPMAPAASRTKPWRRPTGNLGYKVIEGKIREITEYLDTGLITTAFGH